MTIGFYDLISNHTKDNKAFLEEGEHIQIDSTYSDYGKLGSLSYDMNTATFIADPVGDYYSVDVLTVPYDDNEIVDVDAKLKTVDFLDDNDIQDRSTMMRVWIKTDIRDNTINMRNQEGFSTVEVTSAIATFKMHQTDEEINEDVSISRYCGTREAIIHEIPQASGNTKGVSVRVDLSNEGIINGMGFKVVDPQKGGQF